MLDFKKMQKKKDEFESIHEEMKLFHSRKVVIEFFLTSISWSLLICSIVFLTGDGDKAVKIVSSGVIIALACFLIYVKHFIKDVEYEYIDDYK